MKSLLAIVMILFVFISTALPQGVDKRSRLLFQDRDYQSYGLSHFKKNNRIGEDKDIRRKFLSDIVLTEDDAFPERISKRLNLRSDRTEKETGINLHNELNKRGIKGDVAESNNAAWVKHYGSGLAPSSDVATNIAIDNLGNVYITGYSTKLPFGTDYYTVKYNASGDLVWSARYGGDQYIDNVATAISVDGSGNVYVTGRSYGSGTSHDYATIKYNSNGLVQWVQRYNGPGNSDDYARAISVDGSGNVYVTGTSTGNGWSIYTTIKYTQQPVSVEDVKTDLPVTYNLFQNYPNPFNPTTKIKFALLERENVNLSIYSLLGEKVAELINMEMDAGYHEADWNASKFASGVYFYQIKAGSFIRTKKLLLLK